MCICIYVHPVIAVPSRLRRYLARQRMPFPHISGSEPTPYNRSANPHPHNSVKSARGTSIQTIYQICPVMCTHSTVMCLTCYRACMYECTYHRSCRCAWCSRCRPCPAARRSHRPHRCRSCGHTADTQTLAHKGCEGTCASSYTLCFPRIE